MRFIGFPKMFLALPALGSLSALAVAAFPGVAFAQGGPTGVTFTFTESGGNVLMASSGSLNTSNLVTAALGGWGGTGIETNAPPESDIMGSTDAGDLTDAFGFNSGTDLSPWVGNLFVNSDFNWSRSGTTQFATYNRNNGQRTPGIGIGIEDLVGSVWTPNESWSQAGTFASLGLTPGSYMITDAVTGEFINIQVGSAAAVPEPGSLLLLALAGLPVVGLLRRRKA